MLLYRIPEADKTASEGSHAAPWHTIIFGTAPIAATLRHPPATATTAEVPAMTAEREATRWTTTSSALNNVGRIHQHVIDRWGGGPHHTKERIADAEAILAVCRGKGITVSRAGEFEADSTASRRRV